MNPGRFGQLVQAVVSTHVGTTRRVAVVSVAALLGFGTAQHAETRKRKMKKSCKGGKVRCGNICCPRGQGCVAGQCGCPPAKCAQATDPTNDQLEGCFCDFTVAGFEVCMSSIPCGEASPCVTNDTCPPGMVCELNGCGEGDHVCVFPCLLG
jgi:hypothetical protein